MDKLHRLLAKLRDSIDIVLIIYAIKRFTSVPQKYNKPVYAFLLAPIMLVQALMYNDRIAYRYRKFLIGFTFPKVRIDTKDAYVNCSSHKLLSSQSLDASCWDLFLNEAPITAKKVVKLYSRFYVLQAIVVALRAKKMRMRFIKQAAINTARSSAFLAGQTILVRIQLCLANKVGMPLTPFNVWLMCFLNSMCIYFERSDRVGQINNLVLAHIFIGWLKKINALSYYISVPIFCAAMAKDRGKVQLSALLFSLATTLVF